MIAETANMDAATADVIRRVEEYLAAHEEVSRERFAKMAGISGGARGLKLLRIVGVIVLAREVKQNIG